MAKNDSKAPGASGGSRGGSGKSARNARVSVASARKSGGDKTQLIIGAIALAAIVGVIIWGVMLYSKNSATVGDGYGSSTKSVATVDDSGVITVKSGEPKLVLDVYEDALCPNCADFEHQYGQQMAKALDDGQLELNFRMVDFLNQASFSKDYSTRAYAALISVAKIDGAKPGVWAAFHSAIYATKTQPKENGTADLSNSELAKIAADAGASSAAQEAISSGAEVEAASKDAQANLANLRDAAAKVGRTAGTPTVAKDGLPLATNNVDWLTTELASVYGPASSEAAPSATK